MIIWLNGAFGAGKTQTAYELNRRLPGSYVYDPENAGFFIRDNLPPALLADDFQDYPMWRAFNFAMLDDIASRFDGHIIVPMTITNPRYYDELPSALSRKHDVRHFILYAQEETILRRLASRLETRRSWAAQQAGRCIRAFNEEITEQKVHTDHLSISQTAEQIARLAGITLPEDRRSGFHKSIDRIMTQLRQIR